MVFHGQIANYVANGGFEKKYNCSSAILYAVKGWRTIDSLPGNAFFYSVCNSKVPFDGVSYHFHIRIPALVQQRFFASHLSVQ
jgi:hypothetical protein